MAGATSKLVSARERYSNAENISDAADDLRTAGNLCGIDRLSAIAYELDNIAASLRTAALAEANDSH